MLTCSSQVITYLSYGTSLLAVTIVNNYAVAWLITMPWHAPARIKRGGHFGVLTGMWVFQNVTLHRETDSAKSQAKIRFAFHFVERNKYPRNSLARTYQFGVLDNKSLIRRFVEFLLVVCVLTRTTHSPKYSTTRKHTQRYYTTKRLIRYVCFSYPDLW